MIVKHRRGTTKEWRENDIIPEAGELVIEECDDGTRRAKFGTGYEYFSDLPYIDDKLWEEIERTKTDLNNEITRTNNRLSRELVEAKNSLEERFAVEVAVRNEAIKKLADDVLVVNDTHLKQVEESDEKLQKEIDETSEELHRSINELDTKITTGISGLNRQLNTFDSKITGQINTQSAEFAKTLDNARNSIKEDYISRITELTENLQEASAELAELTAQATDSRKIIADYSRDINNKLNVTKTDLKTQIETQAKRIDKLIVPSEGEPVTNEDIMREFEDLHIGYNGELHGTAGEAVRAVSEEVQELRNSLSQYIGTQAIDGLRYDKEGTVGLKTPYMLYLTANKEVLPNTGVQIIGGAAVGGGGSSSLNIYRITPQEATFKASDNVILAFRFEGKDSSGEPITRAEAEWYFDEELKAKSTVRDGNNEFDITKYLAASETYVYLVVRDGNGNVITKDWTVTRVELALTSDFNDKRAYTAGESFVFTYKPTGTIAKKLFIKLDGKLLKFDADSNFTKELSADASGQILTYENVSAFTSLTHGVHTLEAYLVATIDGTDVPTPSVFKEIIIKEPDSPDALPLISASTQTVHCKQYATENIVYTVYDPGSELPLVDIFLDESTIPVIQNKEIPLNPNYFDTPTAEYPYNALEAGEHTVTIACGTGERRVVKTVKIVVDSINEDLSPITSGLVFDFNPALGDNSKLWEDREVTMSCSPNFDWTNGGYKIDENGDPYFCVKAGTTATIDYELFADNAKERGKEFKVIFKTTNVRQRDTSFLKCLSNNIGLDMRVESAILHDGSTSSLRTDYCENAIIEYEFNINIATDMMLVMSYEDGTPSKPYEYTNDSSFTQPANSLQPIIIGGEDCDCDVHIYRLKAYNVSLSDTDIKQNFIADARNLDEKLARWNRNNIYDNGKLITTSIDGGFSVGPLMKAAPDLRYVFLEVPQFTNDKGNKIDDCTVYFRYPAGTRPQDNWTCTGVRHRGQGTSSNIYGYAGRNIDLCMDRDESLFIWQEKDADGNTITKTGSKITLTDTSVPTDYLNIKVNIASSENANNAELARRFNKYQPFERYAKKKDSRVKDTMEFYNCVVFIRETGIDADGNTVERREFDDSNWHFYAIGNIGDSKKTDDTRVNNSKDPMEHVVEIMDADAAIAPLFAFPRYIDKHSYKYLDANGHNQTIEFESTTTTDEWAPGNTAYDILYSNDFHYEINDKQEIEFKSFGAKSFEFRYEMSKISDAQRLSNINAWRNFYNFIVTATDEDFCNKLQDYMVVDSALYYYLFTERYTMVDNRAKNSFWHYGKVYISNEEAAELGATEAGYYIIDDTAAAINKGYRYDLTFGYDMDTALGIDNTGDYVFAYGKEDTDHYRDDPTAPAVFRAHDSTFFCRLRDLFSGQLRTIFRNCDQAGAWDATNGDNALIPQWDRSQAQFPEELWRLDYERKYYRPYKGISIDGSKRKGIDKDFLTTKFFGRKKYARRAFEINQEIYFATKYFGSKALLDFAKWRGTAPETTAEGCGVNYSVSLVPYSDMYLCIQRGGTSGENPEHSTDLNGKPLKIKAGKEYTFESSATKADFIYVYAAGWLQAIGDISRSYVDEVLTGPVTRLQSLILGNNTTGYSNNELKKVDVTQNALLEHLDLSNVTGLEGELDLTANINLKTLKAKGTNLSSVSFAPGGKVTQVELPTTVSKIALKDLKYLSADPPSGDPDASYFDLPDVNNVQSLTIEDCPNFTISRVLEKFSCVDASGERILKNIRLTRMAFGNYTYDDFINDFGSLGGIDINGDLIPNAWLDGTIHFTGTLTGEQYSYISNNYSGLKITYDTLKSTITFKDTDCETTIHEGTSTNATDYANPVYYGDGEIPEGMIAKPTKAPSENGEFNYDFLGWSTSKNVIVSIEDESDPLTEEKRRAFREDAVKRVEGNRVLYPVFEAIRCSYNVTFKDGNNELFVLNLPYGTLLENLSDIAGYTEPTKDYYEFKGWATSGGLFEAVTGDTICWAQFEPQDQDRFDGTDDEDDLPGYTIGQLDLQDTALGNGYTINGNNLTITECYNKYNSVIKVPETVQIDGSSYRVTNLGGFSIINGKDAYGKNTYGDNTTLEYVILPKAVNKIENSAFKNCKNLATINLPDSLTIIGEDAFDGCNSLTSIVIPDSVTSFGPHAFRNCSSLQTFTVPKNLEEIPATCFFGCSSLLEVNLPDTKNGIYKEGNKLWWYVDGVKTHGGLMLIGNDFYYAKTNGEILTNTDYWISKTNDLLPEENYTFGADGKMINAPNKSGLPRTLVGHSLKNISSYAFYECKLEKVTIPSTVTQIATCAFSNMKTLKTVIFKGSIDTIKTIHSEAFSNSGTEELPITFKVPWSESDHTDKFGVNVAFGAKAAKFEYNYVEEVTK